MIVVHIYCLQINVVGSPWKSLKSHWILFRAYSGNLGLCSSSVRRISSLFMPNWLILIISRVVLWLSSRLGVPQWQPHRCSDFGNPALCGIHPLVSPYYSRLGDLLCFIYVSLYCVFCMYMCISCSLLFSRFSFLVFSFCTVILLVGSFDLYCVGGDIKPCSINQSWTLCKDLRVIEHSVNERVTGDVMSDDSSAWGWGRH